MLIDVFVVIVVSGQGEDGLGQRVERAAVQLSVGNSNFVNAFEEFFKDVAAVRVGRGVAEEDEVSGSIIDP